MVSATLSLGAERASASHYEAADEMFFYRDDGLFRYYNINPTGSIGSPILAGDNYTKGWSSITAVDLDGDGQDEMFFYRDDGLFRYYNINPNGSIGSPILAGDNYTKGWSSITAVQLDLPIEHVSDCSTARIVSLVYDAPGNDNFNPNGEYVVLRNVGADPADFTGCRLHDAGAIHTYFFPNGFRLAPGAQVRLYTGSGTNTSTALYWGNGAAIWNNEGDTATLRRSSGAIVHTYSY